MAFSVPPSVATSRMTWKHALDLCFDQVPLIAKPLPPDSWHGSSDWQERVHILFEAEHGLRLRIDEDVRLFISKRILPQPPAGIQNFLTCQRFQCACDLLEILLVGGLVPQPKGRSDSGILNWLLIETWSEWRWDTWLKLQALRSFGGDFYEAPVLPPYAN